MTRPLPLSRLATRPSYEIGGAELFLRRLLNTPGPGIEPFLPAVEDAGAPDCEVWMAATSSQAVSLIMAAMLVRTLVQPAGGAWIFS